MDVDLFNSSQYYTYNTSMTCPGFYDLTTSVPIYFQTSSNFTGSPESSLITKVLVSDAPKYAPGLLTLVEPEHYLDSPSSINLGSKNAFYDNARTVYGFITNHANQILGLGLNSTFHLLSLSLYATGWIASRSLGLYYGVPSSNAAEVRNGTVILGGYSNSRLSGNFSEQTYPIGEFTLPKQCPWEVSISSVSVGSTIIISKPFTACVEPSELSLALPAASFSGSLPSEASDHTITLSNGLIVSIPSSLASTRGLTSEDMESPILGVPFLSQVYLFADYQERQLYTGLANHTEAYLVRDDDIQCVEHTSDVGDLGWAVGIQESTASGAATSSAAGSEATGKKNAAVRAEVYGVIAVGCVLGSVMGLGWMF